MISLFRLLEFIMSDFNTVTTTRHSWCILIDFNGTNSPPVHMGLDNSSTEGKMMWKEFKLNAWEEIDAEVKISCYVVCQTDLHTLKSGWVGCIKSHPRRIFEMA
ncbi:hypothetical protein V1522DRAFT_412654 [Lipomyces starkeyi]